MGLYTSFYPLKSIKAYCTKSIIKQMDGSWHLNLKRWKTESKNRFWSSIQLDPTWWHKKLGVALNPAISKTSKTTLKPIKQTLRSTVNNRIS